MQYFDVQSHIAPPPPPPPPADFWKLSINKPTNLQELESEGNIFEVLSRSLLRTGWKYTWREA